MKRVIPLLILMSLLILITETVAQDTPGPPTNFTVTQGDRQLTLEWAHPSNINIANISRYRLRSRAAGASAPTTTTLWPGATLNPEAFTENPSYKFIHLINGIESTFTIAAVNDNGQEGTISAAKTGTPMMPAPEDFTATLDAPTTDDRTVTLSWTGIPQLPFHATNRDVTDYEYSQNGGAWTSIGSTSTSHLVTGLENGRSYTF
ncbi:MAG: fibronectin type III domain-containing protein, partial [Candidatus Poribacteria bacterium]|nr:fibronectin type III domain-containing protein [Candidatus Poribacteria bacterium]